MHWGLPLTLLVAALWYAPVIALHGKIFLNEFFVQQHFARYTSNKYLHAQPFYYYLPVTLFFSFPWTVFLITSLIGWKRASGSNPVFDKLRLFALVWFIVPVAFFSLSGSKLSGYILPALPGVMVLAAMEVATYVRGEGKLGRVRLTGALLLLLGIGVTVYAARVGSTNMDEHSGCRRAVVGSWHRLGIEGRTTYFMCHLDRGFNAAFHGPLDGCGWRASGRR
jgi:4-amino-4-deoxy-L-arabinose transferase